MAGVITASKPSWIAPFTGLRPRQFGKLVTVLRREGADAVRKGRPWSLPREDRALLVEAYWRTNLTMRQLAASFGMSKSAADRIADHLGPMLALQRQVRARVEHVFARMKTWKILRDCRLKGDGVHHAMLGIARMHNLALARGDSKILGPG
ncbi:transposase family protein [Streptomyces yangpuensis]|uniref:Transposase family protein n=1 Tax=Streptomyces yangpuensis TaxID=1648182 RepID=A0ABY5PQ34_9ACTN|nr:transposase family protein [Streptomyces yangpuensis]UUY46110.1 transposase family protein [Streptomyces yangpuensis]